MLVTTHKLGKGFLITSRATVNQHFVIQFYQRVTLFQTIRRIPERFGSEKMAALYLVTAEKWNDVVNMRMIYLQCGASREGICTVQEVTKQCRYYCSLIRNGVKQYES